MDILIALGVLSAVALVASVALTGAPNTLRFVAIAVLSAADHLERTMKSATDYTNEKLVELQKGNRS